MNEVYLWLRSKCYWPYLCQLDRPLSFFLFASPINGPLIMVMCKQMASVMPNLVVNCSNMNHSFNRFTTQRNESSNSFRINEIEGVEWILKRTNGKKWFICFFLKSDQLFPLLLSYCSIELSQIYIRVQYNLDQPLCVCVQTDYHILY